MRDLLVRGRLQRRYLVLVTADAAQARALTTKIQGVETLSAISDATVVQSDPEGSVERASSTSRRCAGARVQGLADRAVRRVLGVRLADLLT